MTRRGWSLLLSSFVVVFFARLLGLPQLWIIAASMWCLIAGCVMWMTRQHVELSATRSIPEHLQVSSEGRVDLLVINAGSSTSATTQYADQFDGGERHARFSLHPLSVGDKARAAYRVPTHRRGRFQLGPLVATIEDPFGITKRAWEAATRQEVIIHPRIFEVLALPELAGSGVDTDSRHVVGRPDVGGEFHTLRDYSATDDLRHVHWKSTAKRGRLMVRQDESRRRAPVLVLLDTRAIAHNEVSFERAVEATASIVTALTRSQRPFEVVTTAGEPLGQPGRRHLGSVLDELAVIEPVGANRIVPALRGTKSSAVVAVMGEQRDGDHAAAELMVQRGGSLALVLCRARMSAGDIGGNSAGSGAGQLAIRSTKRLVIDYSSGNSDFATLWNGSILSWQQNETRHFSQHR